MKKLWIYGLLWGVVNAYNPYNFEAAKNGEENLAHTDLSGAHLEELDMSDCDLQYANLKRAHLKEANLNGADLSHAQCQITSGRAHLNKYTTNNK